MDEPNHSNKMSTDKETKQKTQSKPAKTSQFRSLWQSPLMRWLDIAVLISVSYLLIWILNRHFRAFIWKYLAFAENWPSYILYPFWFTVGVMFALVLTRLRGLPRFYKGCVHTFFRYPPTYLAAVLLAGIYFSRAIIQLSLKDFLSNQYLWELVSIITPLSGFILTTITLTFVDYCSPKSKLLRKLSMENLTSGNVIQVAELNNDQFMQWISAEAPIKSIAEDCLNHNVIANRIADYLLSTPPQNVVLTGSYGSGKSSTINLAKGRIRQKLREAKNEQPKMPTDEQPKEPTKERHSFQHVIFCDVGGWGRSRRSILRSILTLAIDEVGKYTDCLSLASVPQQYVSALQQSGNALARIASTYLEAPPDPMIQLQKLDNILATTKIRLIISLDDLDRGANKKLLLQESLSLLDNFANLKNIGFVISMRTNLGFDDAFERVSRQSEALLNISAKQAFEIIKRFRRICLHKFSDDIDTLEPKDRAKHLGIAFDEEDQSGSVFNLQKNGARGGDPIFAICSLVGTVRKLKHVLHRTKTAWDKLHGEVDFDELLVITVLRLCAPNVFGFLIENISELRSLRYTDQHTNKRDWYHNQLKSTFKKNNKLAYPDAEILMLYLFPWWSTPGRVNAIIGKQQISQSRVTDYWQRILTEEVIRGEFTDQCILKWIRKINDLELRFDGNTSNAELKTLIKYFSENREFSYKFEYFAKGNIGGEAIQVISTELFKHSLSVSKASTDPEQTPGFRVLHNLSLDITLDRLKWMAWLNEQLRSAMETSIRFGLGLIQIWGRISSTEDRIKTITNQFYLQCSLFERTSKIWLDKPSAYADALDPNRIQLSYNLLVLHEGLDEATREHLPDEIKVTEWGYTEYGATWFPELLLAACKVKPQVMVPQIAYIIERSHELTLSEKLQTDGRFIYALFGNKTKDAMKAVLQEIDYSLLTEENRKTVVLAKHEAKAFFPDSRPLS